MLPEHHTKGYNVRDVYQLTSTCGKGLGAKCLLLLVFCHKVHPSLAQRDPWFVGLYDSNHYKQVALSQLCETMPTS
jgi:hypothetical protein